MPADSHAHDGTIEHGAAHAHAAGDRHRAAHPTGSIADQAANRAAKRDRNRCGRTVRHPDRDRRIKHPERERRTKHRDTQRHDAAIAHAQRHGAAIAHAHSNGATRAKRHRHAYTNRTNSARRDTLPHQYAYTLSEQDAS